MIVTIKPLMYQFSDTRVVDNDYDANWLDIEVTVTYNGDSGTCIAPMFLTWEIAGIPGWVDRLLKSPSREWLYYQNIEGYITIAARRSDASICFRIYIDDVVAARSLVKFCNAESCIEFDCLDVQATSFLQQLTSEMEAFPIRRIEADGPASRYVSVT